MNYSHQYDVTTNGLVQVIYLQKNIPIPSRDSYLRNLIEKAESVLKRMRWKAHFFLKGENSQENTRNFGLLSNKTPPTVLELEPFEESVIKLLETTKFRDRKDYFQDTLANDLKKKSIHPTKCSFYR